MNFRFIVFVLVLLSFNCPLFSAEPNDANYCVPATGVFKQDVARYLKVSFDDAKKTYFNSDNLLLLLLAGGGSITLHDKADDTIADNFRDHRSIPKDLDHITDLAGNPGIHFAATGIWYWMAAKNKDDLNVQRSWVMLRALGVTSVTTLMLKGIVQNHTPNGKNWAWPSGHTASSFCVASVLHEFYGPKVGIPAYLAAGFVGYRMMDSGDHWASDVLFGSVLGYVVGHAIAGENKQIEFAGFKVQPLVTTLHAKPSAGIALAKRF
ncbi:MAG: phosphatase PAP2 family protein [Planctomycetes bacterium]|nr:phosphatase PAP2 family protein [Planctomycetota bacterium]MBU1518201.1 phosphatase PAP2 family protein [Planctomycetota bacterium]MBU2458672.1 phosphatase PAP2 family protein [Planctomycetota bacterium]MBU2596374.1 phosphatase PAP2 family protein [Planctomycetota bacterium]